eukprot:527647-Rhodomonas_salina.2
MSTGWSDWACARNSACDSRTLTSIVCRPFNRASRMLYSPCTPNPTSINPKHKPTQQQTPKPLSAHAWMWTCATSPWRYPASWRLVGSVRPGQVAGDAEAGS